MRFVAVSGRGKDAGGKPVPAASTWYAWTDRSRPPVKLASANVPRSPSFSAFVGGRNLLFTTSEDEGEGRISLNDRGSEPSSRLTGGQGAVHAAVDRSGRFVAVANYRATALADDLSVAVFPFGEDGRLGERVASARHEGSGPDKSRQASPHNHCVMFSPDNRLLAAVDLGTDGLWLYHFDQVTGAIQRAGEVKLPPGCGPRHCVFHPSRPFVYVCGELDSTLLSLRYDSGAGTADIIDSDPATGMEHQGRNYPSGLAISPDGHYLMLANRGADTIATFWIDPETGMARLRDEVPCGGTFPRAIRLDRSGRTLAVANQKSGNVVLFARDFATGKLTPMPHGEVELPAALDVIFIDPV